MPFREKLQLTIKHCFRGLYEQFTSQYPEENLSSLREETEHGIMDTARVNVDLRDARGVDLGMIAGATTFSL